MHSALYEGSVPHRRFGAVHHEFRHRLAIAYVDLAELGHGGELAGLTIRRRWSILRFDRRDYLGDRGLPLDVAVRDLVEQRTGRRPSGPVRLLTQLRPGGLNFNPVSLYYCFDSHGSELEAVVFEVTSTPWGERHAYVVTPESGAGISGAVVDKALHVSPFMAMDREYRFSCATLGTRCTVRFELWRHGERTFDADLWCVRAGALDRSGRTRMLVRHPLMPLVVSSEIYFEAARLLAKRTPFHRHPDRATVVAPEGTRTRRKVA